MKKITIGLFGFGTVGEGIYKVLSQKLLEGATIKKIVVKQPHKKRNAPQSLFSTQANDILNDPKIDLVVELIDDADAAYEITTKAIENGKSVISANKKMIAHKHKKLIALSKKHQVSFLYEAAVCGSIPIIRNLEEYFDNDLLNSIKGIVNGSTNYILSQMVQKQASFDIALKTAQEKGFAETDPSLDVEGVDAAYKLSILSLHAFGKQVLHDNIIRKGITSIHPFDMQYAKEKKWVIKLIAKCSTNELGQPNVLSVLPTFVPKQHALGQTNNEFNGVMVGSSLADEQFFYGKGAGRFPTSSAVLSDISAYTYGYQYAYKKGIETYVPAYQGTGKFYLGFENSYPFDEEIFTSVEEHFTGKNRTYFVGDICYQRLNASNILSDPDISIISYDH